MAIPETFAERVKLALKGAGLTISELARRWGVDRSALSERIAEDRMDEDELGKLAALVKQPKPWLRYGVRGDFLAGVAWAATEMQTCIEHVVAGARTRESTTKVFEADVSGEPVREATAAAKRQKRNH